MSTDVTRWTSRPSAHRDPVGPLPLLAAHGLRSFLRDPVAAFFTVALPVVFLVFIAGLFGDAVVESRGGVSLAQFFTPALAVFGAAQAAFCLLAADTARLREQGVFKRLRATPVAPWTLVGGRILTSAVVAVGSATLVFAVGVTFYDVQLVWKALPAAVVTLVVGVAAFAALGLAVASVVRGATAVQALTNGLLITLAFVSDVFTVAARMPEWLDRLGWFFPLRHFATAMADAFNPAVTGSGFRPGQLAVLAAWGLAGAVIAVRRFSWEPPTRSGGRATAPSEPRAQTVLTPCAAGRLSAGAMLRTQIDYAFLSLRRDGSAVFFAVVFPVLLMALLPVLNAPAGPERTAAAAQLLPAMATYGLAVTVFSVIPSGIAQSRERRALARLAATPMPFWSFVAGRVAVGLAATTVTAAALVIVATLVFGVRLAPARLAAAAVVFVVAVACFAALGFAVLAVVRRSQTVIAVTLGSLLSLSFISDVFVIGVTLPRPLEVIGDLLPLRHASHALTATVTGGAAPWADLAVLLAWMAVGLLVARRIRWVEG
jgi:ABC-2 type transport system permease protein